MNIVSPLCSFVVNSPTSCSRSQWSTFGCYKSVLPVFELLANGVLECTLSCPATLTWNTAFEISSMLLHVSVVVPFFLLLRGLPPLAYRKLLPAGWLVGLFWVWDCYNISFYELSSTHLCFHFSWTKLMSHISVCHFTINCQNVSHVCCIIIHSH